MQLCFDIFYDEELLHAFHSLNMNSNLANFISLLPEIMLLIDTVLKFFTGFYENGIIVEEKSIIAHHYLKKGLVFDILSYLPVTIQSFVHKYFPNYGWMLRLFQMLMLFKLKRVKTAVSNYQEIISANGKHDCFLSACKLMYVIIFIAHLNACIFHAVAFYAPDDNYETWLTDSGLKHSSWVERYVNVFYWSVSVMATIGYGEKIGPRNNLECVVGSFILIESLLLSGYCINTMKELVDMMTKDEKDYKYYFC